MLVGNFSIFKRVLVLALSILVWQISIGQNSKPNPNAWGFSILNGVSLPYQVVGSSEYAYIKFSPNYHFGFGAQYNFNFKNNFGLIIGFDLNYRSISAKIATSRFLINNELNLNDPFNLKIDENKDSFFQLGLQYQSLSIPILFNYKIKQNKNIFYSFNTGLNLRYYFSSAYTFSAEYFADANNTVKIESIYADFDINGNRSFELDSKTELAVNFRLKNKSVLELAFVANIPFASVNKAEVIYMRNTTLESKHNVKINDIYFGLKIAYLFQAKKINASKLKNINDENENYYKNDAPNKTYK